MALKTQEHFSHERIETRSVRERCKRQRGCLNIFLKNDKSTLKQFSHFFLYWTMSSIFVLKKYPISKIPCSPAIFSVSMPNVADGVNITHGNFLVSAVRGQTCLLSFPQTPGACSAYRPCRVLTDNPRVLRVGRVAENSMVRSREESSTQGPLGVAEWEGKISNRFSTVELR